MEGNLSYSHTNFCHQMTIAVFHNVIVNVIVIVIVSVIFIVIVICHIAIYAREEKDNLSSSYTNYCHQMSHLK